MLMDPYENAAFLHHRVSFRVSADIDNETDTTIRVQESEDGSSWADVYRHAGTLVPGGEVDFVVNHNQRWVRVLIYSEGGGIVEAVKITPEAQTLPAFVYPPPVPQAPFPPQYPPRAPYPMPESLPGCPIAYTFEAWLFWVPYLWWMADLDLYTSDASAGEVVWRNNTAGTSLSLNHNACPGCNAIPAPPEIISGAFTEENSFHSWFNQLGKCAPEWPWWNVVLVQRRLTVTNVGLNTIVVNGTPVLPTDAWVEFDTIAYAGYDNGDQDGYTEGTLVAVTSGCEEDVLT